MTTNKIYTKSKKITENSVILKDGFRDIRFYNKGGDLLLYGNCLLPSGSAFAINNFPGQTIDENITVQALDATPMELYIFMVYEK